MCTIFTCAAVARLCYANSGCGRTIMSIYLRCTYDPLPFFPFLLKVSLDVDIWTGKPTLANGSMKLTISHVLPLWSESVFHIL